MGRSFKIRDATEGDLVAINDIYNRYVLTSTCTFQENEETLGSRKAWFTEHGKRYPVIVAEEDGEVIAWASLSKFHRRSAGRFTLEDSVYVHKDKHGKGAGTALLGELIVLGRALGYRSIVASIAADQEGSIALHSKLGFVEVGHLKDVGFKFGKWVDVKYLQLLL